MYDFIKPAEKETLTCRNCSLQIYGKARFCPACGEYLDAPGEWEIFRKVKRETNRQGFIILTAIIAMIIMTAILWTTLFSMLKFMGIIGPALMVIFLLSSLFSIIMVNRLWKIKCPGCRHAIRLGVFLGKDYRFCTNCGLRIGNNSKNRQSRFKPLEKSDQPCSLCGNTDVIAAAFCRNCGANLGSSIFVDENGNFYLTPPNCDENEVTNTINCKGCGCNLLEFSVNQKRNMDADGNICFNNCPACGINRNAPVTQG